MVSYYYHEPNYAVSPGEILEEHLSALHISQAEFARRCGRSPKLISDIIAEKAPVEPETALQFEKALGVQAHIWIGLESKYRLFYAKKAEEKKISEALEWGKNFPVRELVRRNYFSKPESETDRILKLLEFFGVASIDAWNLRYQSTLRKIHWRQFRRFGMDDDSLAVWLRIGEIDSLYQDCLVYEKSQFNQATRQIKRLSRYSMKDALAETRALCNQAGVALVYMPSLPNTNISGAARWLSPRQALIQLSSGYESNDQLWLRFFHEAAHILRHGKQTIFVDRYTCHGHADTGEAESGVLVSETPVSRSARQKSDITQQHRYKSVPAPSERNDSARSSGESSTPMDQDNSDGRYSPEELEAEKWAFNALVPRRTWRKFKVKLPHTRESVQALADQQDIAPGIIVAMLQREGVLSRNELNELKEHDVVDINDWIVDTRSQELPGLLTGNTP